MELKTMTIDELELRKSAIAEEVDKEDADLDALEEEAKAIKEELEERKATETKKEEIRSHVANGEGLVIEKVEIEERKEMNTTEVRASKEYKNAYGEYVKNNYDMEKVSAEMRALLTVNAENGTVEVPVNVLEKIQTAWENDEIMQRITKTFFKGNLKIGYEQSATGAVVHKEGSGAVTPEELVIAYIELIPEMLKKVVEVSDEVLANNETMVDYLYDEIEYQIVKLAAAQVIQKIGASALTASYQMAGATPTTADIIGAAALLSGEASDPVVITTRATAGQIRIAALSAGYAYDPFDSMPVLYTDAANLDGAPFMIADLSAVHGNFPEGYGAKFKFDDNTKADEDIVRIIGRLYAGIGVVATGKTVKAVAGSEG